MSLIQIMQFISTCASLTYKLAKCFKKKDTNESKDMAVSKVCLCRQKHWRSHPYKKFKRKIRPRKRR
ncbi:hypothetical protein BSB_40550 [Bacillus stercoris]|nr:hypothetical protein C7M17_00322 [Bacillus subtilis]BEV40982.1 hypothetical protein BSB_40550 [Bacillus stercoris]